jgi:hypothetical protein
VVMCGILFALWVGRHNNGPIGERTNVGVRGSAVNTRVVKLAPLNKDQVDAGGDLRGAGRSGEDVDVDVDVKAGGGALKVGL